MSLAFYFLVSTANALAISVFIISLALFLDNQKRKGRLQIHAKHKGSSKATRSNPD